MSRQVQELRVFVNAAEGRLRHPAAMFAQIVREIWGARHVAVEIFRRNLASQYRDSMIGLLAAFLPALVVTAWCTLINHARVINIPALDVPYPAFVLMSMMLWTTFVESMNAPIEALKQELPALAKAMFPAEAIVLAHIGDVLFHFGVKLILIVAAIMWFQLPIGWTVMFSPLGVLLLVLFGTSIGMILAPLNALYQDVSKMLNAFTTFWLFLTPVLFPLPTEGLASYIVRLNPVTPLLATTRELATTGEVSEPIAFSIMTAATLVLFAVSCTFFRAALPVVIDRRNV